MDDRAAGGSSPSKVRAQVDELPARPDRPDAQLEVWLVKVLGLILFDNSAPPGLGSLLGAPLCFQGDARPSIEGRGFVLHTTTKKSSRAIGAW